MNNIRNYLGDLFGPGAYENAEQWARQHGIDFATPGGFDRFVNIGGFGNFMGNAAQGGIDAATQAAMNAQQQPSGGPPPASERIIRQLPVVQVTPEDLVDPANRECCVCLEDVTLKERVIRLHCAHIFHPDCITDWLHKHCTCPVCRYELPTSDPMYEQGRLQRMRNRKPRFARHELDRLSIKELKQLVRSKNNGNYRPVDKSDLIDHLIQSESIDLISAPEPVEYPLSLLKAMSVSELKRCMSDAGVFFDFRDVVEKDDMIRIFVVSGRLDIVPEVDEQESFEMETDTSVQENDVALSNRAYSDGTQEDVVEDDRKPAAVSRPIVETVEDEEESLLQAPQDERSDRSLLMEENTAYQPETQPKDDSPADEGSADMDNSFEAMQRQPSVASSSRFGSTDAVAGSDDLEASTERSALVDEIMEDVSGDEEVQRKRKRRMEEEQSIPSAIRVEEAAAAAAVQSRFQNLSVSELRAVGHQLSVDLSDCIERQEMVDRLCASEHESELSMESINYYFVSWGISELRAVAAVTDVDLSNASNREDMILALQTAERERPHVARYLQSLAPLANLTVPQLRAVARDWNVPVADCLEKGEILRRLIDSDGPQRDGQM